VRYPIRSLIVAGALVASATSAYAAPAPPPSPKYPGLGIGLLQYPSALAQDPRARIYVIDNLKRGAVIHRAFQVSNGTPYALDVSLYAAASQIVKGSWSPLGGNTANELSRWTAISPSTLHLASGQKTQAQLTVSVPLDAIDGERYAVVWAQAALPGSGPVHQVARVGIREYISVGKGTGPPINFTIDTLTAARTSGGQPEVLAQVHNTGGRAIDLNGSLMLDKGPGGLSAGPFPAKLGTTLAPGQSEPVTVLLDKALPAGPWHARIELQSDLLKRAAEGTITFPSAAGAKAPPVKATAVPLTKNRNVLVPLAVGLILAMLIGLFLFFWLKRRRRRKDEEEQGKGGPGTAPTIPGQRATNDEAVRR
jgi:hypothetical protein